MKFLILVSSLIVVMNASILEVYEREFQGFKVKHNKIYKNFEEETKRFTIFRDNVLAIEEHNQLYEQGLVSFKKGINQFADMTQEELRALLKTHKKPTFNSTKYVKTGATIPPSIDWRTKGLVTEVKNQELCSSCWAFSLTGSIEGAYYRKTNQLVSLSEQQLVDCTLDINYGCDGGNLGVTFPYIEKNGIQSEKSYPYTGVNESCRYNSSETITKVTSYVSISEDEDALLEAVATVGPVSVAMDATYLFLYFSGIYADDWCTPLGLNHAVLIVGYGSEDGKDYWIVKNSYGPYWGENGYFRILRGTNQCGIAEDTVYPIIN